MGVQEHAINVLENNRRLTKRRVFNRLDFKNSSNLKTSKTYAKDKFDVQKAIRKKKLKHYAQYLIMLLVMPLILVICFKVFDRDVGNMLGNFERQDIETHLRLSKNEMESYNLFISSATRYFDSGNIKRALDNFIVAKNIFDSGKRANYGITLCLLSECKLHGTNCDLANQYYQKLTSYENLSNVEKLRLNRYR